MDSITALELKIITVASSDLTKRWSIKEIAARIGHSYPPAYHAVQRLITRGALVKEYDDILVGYGDLAILVAAEKGRSLPKELLAIKKTLESISLSLFVAIAFGSHAKGTATSKSDIDLLLISNAKGFEEQARKALLAWEEKLDLHIINEESVIEMLNRPNQLNVMNEIMKGKIILHGTEAFYEMMRRWKYDGRPPNSKTAPATAGTAGTRQKTKAR